MKEERYMNNGSLSSSVMKMAKFIDKKVLKKIDKAVNNGMENMGAVAERKVNVTTTAKPEEYKYSGSTSN